MPERLHKARVDLPARITRQIGQLLVRTAHIEHRLQRLIYLLADLDEGVGRIVAREPKALDRIDIILDLIGALGLKEPDDLRETKTFLQDVEEFRNLCAHGVWSYSDEHQSWFVQIARGFWPKSRSEDRTKRNKRLYPEGQIIRDHVFAHYVHSANALIERLNDNYEDLEAQLEALRRKSHEPSLDPENLEIQSES